MKLFLSTLAIFALVGLAPQAKATTVKTFTLDQSASSGTGPFGTITLTQATGNTTSVTVLLTLQPGIVFADTGAGFSLTFNIDSPVGATAVSLSGITSGFSRVNSSPITAGPGNTTWGYAVTCSSPVPCQGGNPTNSAGPLSFTVTRTSGLSVNSFTANGLGSFSSDIRNSAGATFVVWDDPSVHFNETPEPMSMSLMGLGLVGLGLMKRYKNK